MNPIRQYGLPFYWLIFAIWAAMQGRYAGFVWQTEYQWGAAIFVLAVITVSVVILHLIIRPHTYSTSSPRFGKAFGFSVLLLIMFSALLGFTDLPPVLYVPSKFAFVTAALTLICAAVETAVVEIRKRKVN